MYLWSTSLYENYAPYVQSQLPDVNIEFIVGNNDLDFYKFLQQNGGLPDIITCCRFSLHDAAPLKGSLMNLAMTNEAGAVYNTCLLYTSYVKRNAIQQKTTASAVVFCFVQIEMLYDTYLSKLYLRTISIIRPAPDDTTCH